MLSYWIEWKQRCALALCGKEAKANLLAFAQKRFCGFAARYASQYGVQEGSLKSTDRPDAWHLMEAHMTIKTTSNGKRYKDWLFARTELSDDDPIDVIQGGATLIMRDVVRELLRREYSPRMMISLDAPVYGEGDEALSLQDLLPGSVDPSQEAAEKEYDDLATEHARHFFSSIRQREQIILFATELGLPLSHTAVAAVAGCKKSVLHDAYRTLLKRIALELQAQYPDDDHESVLHLIVMTIRKLKEDIYQWGLTQESLRALVPLKP